MDCNPPGSSLYRISQERILEGLSFPSPGHFFQPRDWTCVSCVGRQILYHWATQSFFSSHLMVWWESGHVCIWGPEACWEWKDNEPDSLSLSFHVFQWCLEDPELWLDAQTPEGRELEWKEELVLASQTQHPPTGFYACSPPDPAAQAPRVWKKGPCTACFTSSERWASQLGAGTRRAAAAAVEAGVSPSLLDGCRHTTAVRACTWDLEKWGVNVPSQWDESSKAFNPSM